MSPSISAEDWACPGCGSKWDAPAKGEILMEDDLIRCLVCGHEAMLVEFTKGAVPASWEADSQAVEHHPLCPGPNTTGWRA